MLNLSIHGSVGLIGEEAFSSCSNLKCISFYDNVKFIGKSAFYQCFSLIYVSYLGTKSPSYSDLVFADSLVGSVNVVNNYEDTNFCSYPISFLPFSHFTPSDTFSKSDGITPTNANKKKLTTVIIVISVIFAVLIMIIAIIVIINSYKRNISNNILITAQDDSYAEYLL